MLQKYSGLIRIKLLAGLSVTVASNLKQVHSTLEISNTGISTYYVEISMLEISRAESGSYLSYIV